MHFNTVEEYLSAYKSDPLNHGMLPIPLVAEHLGKSPPAVTAMLKAGTLREISIGKRNRFVSISSLIERAADAEREEEAVRKYLLDMISKGRSSVFYEPIMEPLGLSPTVPAHRTKIGAILDKVSQQSYDEHGVVLSVLVHRKTPGNTRPGPGFWEMAQNIELFDEDTMDKDEFVKAHTNAVFEAYGKAKY